MLHENKENIIKVKESDLPLQCPMPEMLKWNAHPRVFLQIKKAPNHEITCPYCSTKYILENNV